MWLSLLRPFVQWAALHPTVPLALDCHSLAGGFSGQSRQIMEGLEERQDRGKQRRKLTAMPLNESCSKRQTMATLHIQPSKIFTYLPSFVFAFFHNLKVSLSHFKVSVHPLPRLWQPGEKRISLGKSERETEHYLIWAHRQHGKEK